MPKNPQNKTPLLVDYLVVIDFEATCEDNGKRLTPQEIIEFPAVLLDVAMGKVIDIFHQYVRPDVNPQLSKFCTKLTGITQDMVDDSGIINLEQAINLHFQWLDRHHLRHRGEETISSENHNKKTFLYVTCGDWDLSTCLPNQLAYHNQETPAVFDQWINIKKAYGKFYKLYDHKKKQRNKKVKGMTYMLKDLKMTLQGRHHSGIDDSKNIARICIQMLEDGWVPLATTTTTTTTTASIGKTPQKNPSRKQKPRLEKEVIKSGPAYDGKDQEYKTVYLIRHGQSKGQAAKTSQQRKMDKNLLDCGLTSKGYNQAIGIRDYFSTSQDDTVSSSPAPVDLVVSSPLTRALHTAVLGFYDQKILVHYDLRELGSQIPENIPRPMKQVLKDLNQDILCNKISVDVESLQPASEEWPSPAKDGPKEGKKKTKAQQKNRIQEAMQWFYRERPERRIAIVCHYNVIRSIIGSSVQPENAAPIPCWMTPEGVVIQKEES